MTRYAASLLIFGLAGGAPLVAGSSWTPIGPFNVYVGALGADPTAPGTLYAGVRPGGVLKRRSLEAGWSAVNGGLPSPLPEVRGFAFDPSAPGTVYAGTDKGVYKTTDGAATWHAINNGLVLPNPAVSPAPVLELIIDPSNPKTLYGGVATHDRIFLPDGGVFKSVNGGSSWELLERGPRLAITALALDPSAPGTIFAASNYAPRYFLVSLARSRNGGETWQELGIPLEPYTVAIAALAVAPGSPSTVYASTGSQTFRSSDGGDSWTPLDFGTTSLAVDPAEPRIVYAAQYSVGVFRSLDAGTTWSLENDGLDDTRVTTLAVDAVDSSRVYAGTDSGGVFVGSFSPPAQPLCSPSPTTLCLVGGRFRLEVSWAARNLGTSGVGQSIPLTTNTGAFWFFQPSNIELVIKVLDGRAINSHFWVFYGALSNVEYTITVTDTETGAEKTYFNPHGRLASVADAAAFLPPQ